MNLKRDLQYQGNPAPEHNVIRVGELMKQIELLAGIRKRVQEGYYERPDVLEEIAEALTRRLTGE
jgi:hypothetical protein